MENTKILLVQKDSNFGAILKDYLSLNDFEVVLAKNGMDGYSKFKKDVYDICILDVLMPYKDGYTLAREIRQKNKKIAIFFLTSKTLKNDIIKGYKAGADDYLIKPYDSEMLTIKINSFVERNSDKRKEDNQFLFHIGSFHLNSKLKLLVFNNEKPLKLTPNEAELLKMLILNQNNLMTRKDALMKIWRKDNYFTSRSMDVYITKLRKYLKHDSSLQILNVHGLGFRLVVKNGETKPNYSLNKSWITT